MKLFSAGHGSPWAQQSYLGQPSFWVLEVLTAVGRTKPRLRPVGENGSGAGLIIRVYTLLRMVL